MSLGRQVSEISANYDASIHEPPSLKLFSSSTNGRSLEGIWLIESKSNSKSSMRYRECQRNHAANIGAHALDGCGEFMPSGNDGTLEALKCAACCCHRNFHRREVEGEIFRNCQQYAATQKGKTSPSALVPQPEPLAVISTAGTLSSRLPGSMIMALGSGSRTDADYHDVEFSCTPASSRKRFRTKFTIDQKDKMHLFADKLGWKIQKHDEEEVQQFCDDTGVKRHVLKVWMHNNKHTLGEGTKCQTL